MQTKKWKIIIAGVLILIIIGGVHTTHSFIGKRDYTIIRIAFMNGYIEGMKLSIEEKEKLGNDKTRLVQTVQSAADGYLTKVENLNN
jgi:hypothetical protein